MLQKNKEISIDIFGPSLIEMLALLFYVGINAKWTEGHLEMLHNKESFPREFLIFYSDCVTCFC